MGFRMNSEDSTAPNSQFTFHRIHGSRIRLSNSSKTATRLEAAKFYDNGVVYSALPLSGHAKFVVQAQELAVGWSGSFKIGVILISPEVFKDGFQPPRYSPAMPHSWVWSSLSLHVGQDLKISYGSVNLEDLKKGDKLGMEISREGTLQFLVNDRSQGTAATNVYSTDKLVYGFVDHYGQAVTSTIAEAFVNPFSLQHLCKRKILTGLTSNVSKLEPYLPTPLIAFLADT